MPKSLHEDSGEKQLKITSVDRSQSDPFEPARNTQGGGSMSETANEEGADWEDAEDDAIPLDRLSCARGLLENQRRSVLWWGEGIM